MTVLPLDEYMIITSTLGYFSVGEGDVLDMLLYYKMLCNTLYNVAVILCMSLNIYINIYAYDL